MWRNIKKGIISIANLVRQMRSAETHTIYLPYYRAKLWKTGGGGGSEVLPLQNWVGVEKVSAILKGGGTKSFGLVLTWELEVFLY